MFTRIKIEIDEPTFRRLLAAATAERRATADQAAVELARALEARERRNSPKPPAKAAAR